MGRHSAPGDEDVDEPTDAGLTLVTGASGDADEARGRHARDAAATAVDTALATEVIDATGVPVAEPAAPTGPIVPVEAAPVVAAPDEAGREATRDEAAVDEIALDEIALDEIALDEIALDEIVLDEVAPGETAAKRQSGTQADLRLLRENPRVRWLVLGAVVVAFAIYTLVMLAIGRLGDYAYWVWIPIVLSGVLVGAVLDWAHRRAKRAG